MKPPARVIGLCLEALPAALALFGAYLYLNFTVGYWHGLALNPLVNLALSAVALTAWTLVVPPRLRALSIGAVLVCAYGLVLVDLCYFRFFGDLPSVLALTYSRQGAEVTGSILGMLRLRDALLLPLLLGGLWFGHRVAGRFAPEARLALRAGVGGGLSLCCFAVLGHALLRDHLGFDFKREGLASRNQVGVQGGVFPYHLVDLARVIEDRLAPPPTPAEAAETATWLRGRAAGRPPVPPYAVGKNVIVIQLESFQGFVVGQQVNGQAVAPTLDALRAQTRYYPETYSQVMGGATSDAEFMTATSLHPLGSGAAFVSDAVNRYPSSLPARLRDRGYETVVFHAFREPTFWNRQQMYPALGFNTFIDGPTLGLRPRIGLGLSDAAFFDRSLPRLEGLKRPFYAMMLTLTSHHPFDDVEDLGPAAFDTVKDPLLRHYLKAVHYTDSELGRFLASLKRDGLWDSSIVMIYGDHPAFFRGSAALDTALGVSVRDPLAGRKLLRIPLFIHVPGDTVRGAQAIGAGQTDFMPTIAHRLALPTTVVFGRDLFAAREGFVPFRNGSFVAGDAYHDAPTGTDWNLRTGERLPPADAAARARVKRHFANSDRILRGDLIPRLLEP